MPKSKRMKPVRAWAVVNDDGHAYLLTAVNCPATIHKQFAMSHCLGNQRIARVEIREIGRDRAKGKK